MPDELKTYEFTDDATGEVYSFDGPADATDEELAFVLSQLSGGTNAPAQQPAANPQNPSPTQSPAVTPTTGPSAEDYLMGPRPVQGSEHFTPRNGPLAGPSSGPANLSEFLFGEGPVAGQVGDAFVSAYGDTLNSNQGVENTSYNSLVRQLAERGYDTYGYNVPGAVSPDGINTSTYDKRRILRDAMFEGLVPGVRSRQQMSDETSRRYQQAVDAGTSWQDLQQSDPTLASMLHSSNPDVTPEVMHNFNLERAAQGMPVLWNPIDTSEQSRDAYFESVGGDSAVQSFDEGALQEWGRYIQAANDRTANDGWVPWLAGSLLGSLPEPTNAINPEAGIARNFVANAAVDLASSPLINANRTARGQEAMTTEEMLANAALAGTIGGLVEVPGAIREARAARRSGASVEVSSETPSPSVQRSVDDNGAPLISVPEASARSRAGQAQRVDTVNSIVDRVNHNTRDWENPPSVEVHTDFSEVPGLSRTQRNNVGFFDAETGSVHVNSEAVLRLARRHDVTPEAVVDAVTFHESLGHYGLAQHFREDLDANLNWMYENGTSGFRGLVDQWIQRNPTTYRGDPNLRTRATEEVLADMSNKGRVPARMFDRFVNTVKDHLRRMGVNLRVSEREVRTILGMAHDAVINGAKHDVRGNGFRWMGGQDSVPDLHARKMRAIDKLLSQKNPSISEVSQAIEYLDEAYAQGQDVSDIQDALMRVEENIYARREPANDNIAETSQQRAERLYDRAYSRYEELWNDPRADLDRRHKARREWEAEFDAAEDLKDRLAEEAYPSPKRWATGDNLFPSKDDYTKAERQEVDTALRTLEQMTEDYTPNVSSVAEVQGMARQMGLTSGSISRLKGLEPGDIAKRLVAYDRLMTETSAELAEMNNRILTNRDYSQKDKYLRTILRAQHITAVLFNNQGEVGRALHIIRTLDNTRKKLENFNEILQGIQGNNISAFASDDVMYRFAQDLQSHLSVGNTAAAAALQRQVLQPYWWQYVLTYRHAAMLSGLGTHAKNFTDSAIMITRLLEEKAGAWVLGKTSRRNAPDRVTSGELIAHTYGIVQALFDNETYYRTFKAFREGYGNHTYGSKIEVQDARIPYVSKVNDALYASDTFFRAFHDNSNLYSLGVREAYNRGYRGLEAVSEGTSIARNPTKAMVDAARKLTDEALLVDTPSGVTSMFEERKAIRPGMNGWAQGLSFTMNMLFPFLRVTDRLIFQGLRRSPLFFLDKNSREAIFKTGGAERDIAISRALMGSAVIAYYWISSSPEAVAFQEEGAVQGQPKDYKKEVALQGGGYRANSVIKDDSNVDATAINLSWIPWNTQNNIASSVATLHDRFDAGGFGAAVRGLLHTLGQQSYAENIGPYIEAVNDEDSSLAPVAAGLAGQFVPAGLRQVNQQFVDPVQRNARGDGSTLDRVQGRVMSAVPGLSDNLPARHSVYGDEMLQGRSTFGLNNSTPIQQDEVSRALQRIERSTREVVVSAAPRSFQYHGERVSLNAAQQEQWQVLQGQYIRQEMAAEVADPAWRTLSVEEQRAIVEDIRKEAYDAAKQEMLPQLGLE